MKLLRFLFTFFKSFFVSSKDFEVEKTSEGNYSDLFKQQHQNARYYHNKYSGKKKYVKAPRIKTAK